MWFQNRRMKWRHTEDAKRNASSDATGSGCNTSRDTSKSDTSPSSTSVKCQSSTVGESSPQHSQDSEDEDADDNKMECYEEDRLSDADDKTRITPVSSTNETRQPASHSSHVPSTSSNPFVQSTSHPMNTITHFPPILNPSHLTLMNPNSPFLSGMKVPHLPLLSPLTNVMTFENSAPNKSHPLSDLYHIRKF